MEHIVELNEYLKSIIIEVNKSKNKYSLNKFSDKSKIFFELSFAENLFKKNTSALALLYCLKRQYNKSISYAFKCTDNDIPIFIANSISDPKKKKEIWLEIFNYYKSNEMKTVEDILQKSKGVLTITDILPHLMGNVQLKDIQTNLNKCIDEYEIKLRKLKYNIKEFSKSEEILNKKISRVENYGQKSLKIRIDDINCSVCLQNLKENNFFLFPCKHAFDFDCLINLLLYYDTKEIGDEYFKRKMESIKNILNIFYSNPEFNKKINPLDKKITLNLGNKFKSQSLSKGFLKNFTFRNEIDNLSLDNEEKIINTTINGLDELLSEECPLCGNETIFDTQRKFGDEDNLEWII